MTLSRRPTFASRVEQAIDNVVGAIASPIVTGIAAFNKRRLPPRDAPHPLLTGIHEPMTEELTLTDLAVEGIITPELDGRYFRIAPNPADADPRSYHFFTGDGMLHGSASRTGEPGGIGIAGSARPMSRQLDTCRRLPGHGTSSTPSTLAC